MNHIHHILLATSEGPELQRQLLANPDGAVWEVELLPHPGQLLTQLAYRHYDLLIVDVALLTTLEATAGPPAMNRIQSITPRTRVILLAGQAERSQAVTCLRQGAAAYLLLPLEPAELSLIINQALETPALPSTSSTDELARLHEANQEIGRTLDLNETLKIFLDKAQQVSRAPLARVYLADRSGNLSQNQVVTTPGYPVVSTLPVRNEAELFRLVQQAAFAPKIVDEPDTGRLPDWSDRAVQAILLIPMLSRDKLIGVLALGSGQPAAFSTGHIRWLSIFCGQAAIAIENAYLFQNLSSAYIDLAQSREKILQSRYTLQVLFDGISDGLYIFDQDLVITALNQVEAERQGFQPDALIGKNFFSLQWASRAPELLNRIQESLHTGRETTWISPEQETEPFLKDREFRIYPIRNRLAQIEQVVVFAQDVSERRRWQASLFRSANLAAVGQLAGSVAHQINNPLTVTMANSQLILMEAQANGEVAELAAAILKAGERIQKIVENLLEFSNQETYVFVQADLIETIEGALALVVRSLKKANIQIIKDYQVQPILPASVSHLKLVWMNLLLNARDAVMEDTAGPRVTVSTRSVPGRKVAVAITDNGMGIPPKNFEQLFRPFFTTKPAGRALGLGLYSAQAIVEHHGGQIKVTSDPGVATTFEVTLPLDRPRDR